MNRLKFGILSTAKIGWEKVIPAMQRGQRTSVVALASRDLARAQKVARQCGVDRAYGSYEELLADPQVDAIYNPLPNHLHVPWSIRALEAGKHVLCEKPIAMSAAQAQALVEAAGRHPSLKVMEAFMYRFHPQWVLARQIVTAGGVGTIKTIATFFSYYNVDAANIRNQSDIGGGGLMDIGCYCISLARFLFDAEPVRVCALVERDPDMQIDRVSSALLDFGGRTATFTCGTQLAPYQRVQIFGDQGRVEIEIPFNAPPDRECRLWHQTNEKIQEHLLPVCDQYTLQGDLFAKAVLENLQVPTPLADAVANMRVIEAVDRSDRVGGWVSLDPGR
jgi:predicted dehydrogenase